MMMMALTPPYIFLCDHHTYISPIVGLCWTCQLHLRQPDRSNVGIRYFFLS